MSEQGRPKMATDIPRSITTPDTVETRLGTLRFFDGLPDEATVQTVSCAGWLRASAGGADLTGREGSRLNRGRSPRCTDG